MPVASACKQTVSLALWTDPFELERRTNSLLFGYAQQRNHLKGTNINDLDQNCFAGKR